MIERNDVIRDIYTTVITISGDNAFDSDGNLVTIDQTAVDTEILRLQVEYDSQEYARNRKSEYPSLDELIVALWEGVVEERMASVTDLEAVRQQVKAKYPKES